MNREDGLRKRAATLARGQLYDPTLRKFVKTNLNNAVAVTQLHNIFKGRRQTTKELIAKKRLNLEEAIIRGREEPAEKYL